MMNSKLRKPSPTTKSALSTQKSFETNKSGRRVSPSSLPPSAVIDLAAEKQQLIEHAKQIPQHRPVTPDKEKLGQLHEALSSHPSDYLVADDLVVDDEKQSYSNLRNAQTATESEPSSSSGSSTFSSAASTGVNLKVEPRETDNPSRTQRSSPTSPALPPGLAPGRHGFWKHRVRLAHALRSCFSGSETIKT